MAIMQHRRATAASMFQNGISQNTKCDIMVSFPKSSHIIKKNYVELSVSQIFDDLLKNAIGGTLNQFQINYICTWYT